MYRIIKKEILNPDVELMVVHAPYVARKCEPGQFIILRVDEDGERIPLTIADYDRKKETVTIIYQVVGYSTKKLSNKNEGDFINDFVGPLGQPAPIHKVKRVLGIGGGVGIAPLYPQMKKMKDLGVQVDVLLGGRTNKHIIMENMFEEFVDNIYYATNDGSKGIKGFVTDKLLELLENGEKYDLVVAIGPLVMMKAIVNITKENNIKTNVSLNPIMIDGTGMCGGCRVTVGGETKFACVDGPDFDGFLVDFDECMQRQSMYKEEEEHICRIGIGDGNNA
ncbi:sulfide/dihydroorotate dehydrogenase-like FAD/NAD-binding protein [Oceanotoga sp. DSM 15011]|uniref:Ferredoxin--NADP+ reductase n=1 Tax=Oceanotoga teriensis TaxID=515440 RepID=A0AA45C6Q2_9BACT|nr:MULTISPECIES: sulfide/dihydroorotate dehydrogenase-like FAD/NAD-binding protein [Oceanotoga]MDO7977810.1 sulfide/dihydroorotate dehydrogenase-like FAD/NAD-binding protein [Oceanotoga teriensis]PWJ93187.1 ferredoxin--NADP+ reductase [Oceanotoga teriensis]UYP01181.1 sulfide/dihydroorotate dehydrogenase-like FAD/NAD-binding protein [Oceanotoga sp. DSM 15011]